MTERARLENAEAKHRWSRDRLASANERRYHFVSAIRMARCVCPPTRSNDSQKAITPGFQPGDETRPEKRFHQQLKCPIDTHLAKGISNFRRRPLRFPFDLHTRFFFDPFVAGRGTRESSDFSRNIMEYLVIQAPRESVD